MAHTPLALLEAWLQPLLAQLAPTERRSMARSLATGLRARQAQRIAEQRNVDGSPYQPRAKTRIRARTQAPGDQRRQRDRIGAMFAKLRTAKHLKAASSSAKATVEITGRAARIAAIHQYGLYDRTHPGGPEIRYPVRELLGINESDQAWLEEQLLAHLDLR
jgi:phage virion morphogenesis protein